MQAAGLTAGDPTPGAMLALGVSVQGVLGVPKAWLQAGGVERRGRKRELGSAWFAFGARTPGQVPCLALPPARLSPEGISKGVSTPALQTLPERATRGAPDVCPSVHQDEAPGPVRCAPLARRLLGAGSGAPSQPRRGQSGLPLAAGLRILGILRDAPWPGLGCQMRGQPSLILAGPIVSAHSLPPPPPHKKTSVPPWKGVQAGRAEDHLQP
ncbi:uncharacterized protein [Vicugna pacos]|uniref:Uncharacterized protein n=1 Tax=Vicugna pacos TaxID=30538 RepID=A0ABM5C6T8_VICPA